MNNNRVKKYIEEKITKEYKPYYKDIVEGIKSIEVYNGSFGSISIIIEGSYYSTGLTYVGNYKAIDGVISRFFCRSEDNKNYKIVRELNKTKSSYILEIYKNGKKNNEFKSDDQLQVKNELIKVVIAEKRRGVKTRYIPIPYSDDIKIIQTFNDEQIGVYKYIYRFNNLNY